jgi:hypothetical protein
LAGDEYGFGGKDPPAAGPCQKIQMRSGRHENLATSV